MKRILSLGLVLILALSSCSVHKTEPQGSQEASLPTQTVSPSESASEEDILPEIRSLEYDFFDLHNLYENRSGRSIVTSVQKETLDQIYLGGKPNESINPNYTTFYYYNFEEINDVQNSPFGETVTLSLLGKEYELKYYETRLYTNDTGYTRYAYHDAQNKTLVFAEDGSLLSSGDATLATIEIPETVDQAITATYPMIQQLTNNFGYQYVSVNYYPGEEYYHFMYYNAIPYARHDTVSERYLITSTANISVLMKTGEVVAFSRTGIIQKESEIQEVQINLSRQNNFIAAKIQEYYNARNDGIERELIASYLRGSSYLFWFKGELYVEYSVSAIQLSSYAQEGKADDIGYEHPLSIILPLRLLVDEKK